MALKYSWSTLLGKGTKMNKATNSQLVIVMIAVFSMLFLGCATTASYKGSSKGRDFTQENVSSIRLGMAVSEIEALFGAADTTYNMTFGKNTDQEWDGLVYKYYGPRDTMFVFAKRRLINTFVFYTGTTPPALNNWTIEYTSQEHRK